MDYVSLQSNKEPRPSVSPLMITLRSWIMRFGTLAIVATAGSIVLVVSLAKLADPGRKISTVVNVVQQNIRLASAVLDEAMRLE